MNYLEFNKWAYQYYVTTTAKNGVCCLAIDEYEIEIFRKQYKLPDLRFKEIYKYPWSELLLEHDYGDVIIPMYFGLIALQCLAAFVMEEDGHIHSSNYNERFCIISGINSIEIERKYSQTINFGNGGEEVKIQELIWMKAKSYFKWKLNLIITIPPVRTEAGRYIQFPKSQSVLNKEDLKEIAKKVFIHLPRLEGGQSESLFVKEFIKLYPECNLNRPHNKKCFANKFRSIFLKQIFNYYNSSHWQKEIGSATGQGRINMRFKSFVIVLINDFVNLYIGNKEVFSISEIAQDGKILLFKKIYDLGEYEQTNIITNSDEIIIISSEYIDFGEPLRHHFGSFNVKLLKLSPDLIIPDCLRPYLCIKNDLSNVYLNGVRLWHSPIYIINFGPVIIGDYYHLYYSSFENVEFFTEIKNYNSLDCIPGVYTIKVPGYTNKIFYIIDENPSVCALEREGLNLTNFKIEKEADSQVLHGIQLVGKSRSNNNNELTVNNWIKSHTRFGFKTNHLLLHAINTITNE